MSVFRNLLDKQRNPKPLAHYNFEGYTNTDHPDKIPDLTGNGYDLSYYGIDFKLMSGFEGYADDWTRYPTRVPSTTDHASSIKNSIAIYNNWFLGSSSFQPGESIPGQIIMVSGMDPDASYVLRYNNTDKTLDIKEDGIYILPGATYTGESPLTGVGLYIYNPQEELIHSVTVQQLPLYPGCAVFGDTERTGIGTTADMAPHFSVGKGFTVICQRYIENIGRTFYTYYSGDAQVNRVFQEYVNNSANSMVTPYSFGKASYADLKMAGIVPYTSTMYDGAGIQKGDTLNIMNVYLGRTKSFRGGMKEFYLFNRDLTQAQIERFISENMVPDPLVYYDVRKQNTKNSDTHSRGTLIDLSGNGNHGVLNNFDYSADGWVETYIDDEMTLVLNPTNAGDSTYASHVLMVRNNLNGWVLMANPVVRDTQIKSFRVRVSGLTDGHVSFRTGENQNLMPAITSDGVYTVPAHVEKSGYRPIVISVAEGASCTIEFLPQTDYIQFDGVTDYINIPSLTEGFKTICMLTEGPDVNVRFYDQRATTNQKYFALFSVDGTIAYDALSTGQTYINGELNTSAQPSDLKGDKICIIHRNDGVTSENSSTPYIGVKYTGKYNGPIKLSKFLGFREYLSDTQIKKVIEKYGLLEGISNGSKVSVNTDELTFGSEGGSQQIQITSNDSWTIS